MIEFESTFDEPPPHVEVCLVYDGRTGRVVSRHQFVGDGTGLFGPDGAAERERMALELVKREQQAEGGKDLRVMHAPAGFRLEPGIDYRVDPNSLAVHGSRVDRP